MRSKLLQSARAVWRAFADTTPAFILPDGFVAMRTRADTPGLYRGDHDEAHDAAPSQQASGLSLPDGTDRIERRQCRPLSA